MCVYIFFNNKEKVLLRSVTDKFITLIYFIKSYSKYVSKIINKIASIYMMFVKKAQFIT